MNLEKDTLRKVLEVPKHIATFTTLYALWKSVFKIKEYIMHLSHIKDKCKYGLYRFQINKSISDMAYINFKLKINIH